MKLLVGLGNPGDKYARNRHNVGFMALEAIADRHRFAPWRRKFSGFVADGEIGPEKVLALKPETYMNESGQAVVAAMRFLKIEPADVIVFHDELDLLPGKLKIKLGGGNAGHNGLRSITQHIGNDYVRVRIGIGHPGNKDMVAHYVLHDFAKADQVWLEPLLEAMAEAAPRLWQGDGSRFLGEVARRIEPEKEKKADAIDPKAPPPRPSPQGERGKGAKHPAGERAGKSQGAIAENIKKWLAARGDKGE
jgi:PTH1 family peptidyl-tRNA hydrolase